MIRKIKRLLGLCEYPGCAHFAKREIVISKNKKVEKIHLCDQCAWVLYGEI